MSTSSVTAAVEDPHGFYLLTLSPLKTSSSSHPPQVHSPAPGHHFVVAITSPQGDKGQTQVVFDGS
jgi:hypothetical protein